MTYQPIFHMWNPNSTETDECYQRALCGTRLPFDGKHICPSCASYTAFMVKSAVKEERQRIWDMLKDGICENGDIKIPEMHWGMYQLRQELTGGQKQ